MKPLKNKNVNNRIEAIDYLFKIPIEGHENEAQLTYFLLVAIYGAAQYCIKTMFLDCRSYSNEINLKKLERKIDDLIQTPSIPNIRDFLLIANKNIDSSIYSDYNALIKQRHGFAHGKKDPTKLEGVTFNDIKKSFSDLKKLLQDIEKQLY